MVAVEIADEADAERDVVEIITVHVATVDLPAPAVADLNFPVAGGTAISDDKVISEPIRHFAHVEVVVLERFRTSLPRSAVVNHDVSPAPFFYGSPIDLLPN